MPVASWPSTLPQAPLAAGYREGLGETTLRTQMEIGPAKTRRRSTAAPRPLDWPLVLTRAQLAILRGFIDSDLEGGALPFTIREPLDDAETLLVRLLEPIEWQALPAVGSDGAQMVATTLKLEVLP